ncbi:hypothetical protein ABZ853_20820 [Streptomyces albidoflavus]
MSALPRTAAALLITSLALLGGAATASADSADDYTGSGIEHDDINNVHHEVDVAAFGDMVLD